MASISNDPGGKRRILFFDANGERKQIRLGKVSKWTAERIKTRVVKLVEHLQFGGTMEPDLVQWVKDQKPMSAKKLARVGLIPDPEPKAVTLLGAFLDAYIAGRSDVKPLTMRHLKDSRRFLVAFFGENRELASTTQGDADDYRRHLANKLGDNSVRRQCGRAKQFFKAAVRKRLIPESPFADMKGCGVVANRSRDYFITAEQAAKVLAACPDNEWRLIFALSRYGGLRCPSETLSLRWDDVKWDQDRIRVPSPKTEHHPGGECRWIPMFPELRPILNAAWDEAKPGDEFVISRYRGLTVNLRTQLEKIINRAGLTPWPKLFHNLRATRETELAQQFPIHVVCEWIGNSQAVATKHYLQVTDEHFAEAAKVGAGPTKVAQNPAQQAHAATRTDQQAEKTADRKARKKRVVAIPSDNIQMYTVLPDGLEPSTY
jgi:integrase